MGIVIGEELLLEMKLRTKTLGTLLTISVIICGAIFGLSRAGAQSPIAATTRSFEPLEELVYEAEFNRSLLRGLNVAELKFKSSRTPVAQSDKQHSTPYTLTLNADISSKGFFTKLFNLKFREQVESTVEPTSFTIQKTTILDEQGKRVRQTETLYDRSKGEMSWTLRDPNNPQGEPRKMVTEFTGQLQDVLSAIYFLRIQQLRVGQPFDIFIGDGGRVYRIPVKVVEKKKMKTVLGKVNTLRLEPELFGPDRIIDEEKGEFSLWVTDDERHIPVSARVKTDYGTFDVKLKRVSNNPAN